MLAPPYNPLRTFVTPDRTRLEVEVLAVRDDATWRASSGRATLLVDGQLGQVGSGDVLRIFGKLAAVSAPDNPGEFDYARHARADRRLCWLSCENPECVTTLARGGQWSWRRGLDALRATGDALLWLNLQRARAGLASAMFLGSREELQPDETQGFLETGTIHLLVISGLNVGILASCLFLGLRAALVPQRVALGLVAAACVLYAATTDAQPPVVRATVMVLLACAAATLGRRAIAYNSIAGAGLIVLALNPCELFQAGTQLSFLSVAALAWLGERRSQQPPLDPLDRLIARTRPWPERAARGTLSACWRPLVTGTVIWLLICPLVMARFHLVSPAAVGLGLVLALPVTLAMATGFGIFLFGWIAPPVAAVFGWLCDLNLAFMQASVDAVRNWPGNHFWVGGPANWWLAVFYCAILAWVAAPRFAPPRRWCLALAAGWVALGLSLPLVTARDRDRLDCTFLSVGHGSAVVVELPGGQTLLYDAGRLGSPTAASRAVAGFLWSRGIRRLDAVVISHADADHYNALPALLSQFPVGAVYVSPMMFERSTPALDSLHAAIDRAGIPLREIWAGDRLRAADRVAIDVLHPPRAGVIGSDNANSIVLAVEFEGRRVLLTGDLESPGDPIESAGIWGFSVLVLPEVLPPSTFFSAVHKSAAMSSASEWT